MIMSRKLKLNSLQLHILRTALADPQGVCGCDASTGKALINRGYATAGYHPLGTNARAFFITDAGRQRANQAADVEIHRDGHSDDPSLMKDLPKPATDGTGY